MSKSRKIKSAKLLRFDPILNDVSIRNTLARDPYMTRKEATQAIYRILNPREQLTFETAQNYLDDLLFKNIEKYDFGKVGRDSILKKFHPFFRQLNNRKDFSFRLPAETNLAGEDIIVTLQYLIALNNGLTHLTMDGEKVKVEVDARI